MDSLTYSLMVTCIFFFLFLHSILTAPPLLLSVLLIDSEDPWNRLLTCYCSGSETGNPGVSLPTPPHLLFFFSSSSLLSTIFLPPYKISRHALNYWLVLSPVRLSLVVYCCPSAAVAQGFFFCWISKLRKKTWSDLSHSESQVRVRMPFHFPPSNNSYILYWQEDIVYE